MMNTNEYRNFRRRSAAGPIALAMFAAWVLVLILAACGEVRQGVKTVDVDRPRAPTLEFRK